MIVALSRRFPSRYDVPVLHEVDTAIYQIHYFTHCLECGFCYDQCCTYGVDVDVRAQRAIMAHADDLEAYLGIRRSQWFRKRVWEDEDCPGGGVYRTRVVDGRCVFLNRNGRGCRLHAFCLDHDIDYHELKSIVDCLFPLTFVDGRLTTAEEVDDRSLICLDAGPTLYRGLRQELRYYFGEALVSELDAIETTSTAGASVTAG